MGPTDSLPAPVTLEYDTTLPSRSTNPLWIRPAQAISFVQGCCSDWIKAGRSSNAFVSLQRPAVSRAGLSERLHRFRAFKKSRPLYVGSESLQHLSQTPDICPGSTPGIDLKA